MKRPKQEIQPLLAAKLRPQRRPPIVATGGPAAPRLRLDRGPDRHRSSDVEAKQRDSRAILANVQQIFGALTAARCSIATGLMHLREMATCIRDAERCGPASHEFDAGQQRLDELLESIGSVATNTNHDGRPLLDGSWSANLREAGSPENRALNLPSLKLNHLGTDSTGARLASLATGGGLALARREFRRSLGVIERATRMLRRAQAEIDAFLAEVVEPLQSALSVAMENATSSVTAQADIGFAAEVGRLTRGDALLAAADAERKQRIEARPGLRLSNHPRPHE